MIVTMKSGLVPNSVISDNWTFHGAPCRVRRDALLMSLSSFSQQRSTSNETWIATREAIKRIFQPFRIWLKNFFLTFIDILDSRKPSKRTLQGTPVARLRRTELTSCLFGCVQVRLLLCFTYVFLVAYPLVAEPIGNLQAEQTPVQDRWETFAIDIGTRLLEKLATQVEDRATSVTWSRTVNKF